jgi:hypothetical protein
MESTSNATVELTSYTRQGEHLEVGDYESRAPASLEAGNGFSLSPTDGGKDAWLFLLAAFVLEALVWGIYTSIYEIGKLSN